MKIEHLRAFLAIYETRSVSAAARSLGISQSGMSAALARLRQRFSDELFVKTQRGMEPTARAHSIVLHARQLVEAADRLNAGDDHFDPALSTDEFRISAGDIMEATALQVLARSFEREAPRARLKSVLLARHELEEAMSGGAVDLALGFFPTLGPNVHKVTVTRFTFACFCRSGHPFAGKRISEAEFSSARYALMDADSSLVNIVEDWLHARRIHRNIVVRASHFHGIPRLIGTTDLIAIVPTSIDRRWLFGGDVSRIELPFSLPRPELHIYWHHTFHHDERNKWFRRLLLTGLRNFGSEFALTSTSWAA
jgi:DNA-binding transcriptional LysR family regulator